MEIVDLRGGPLADLANKKDQQALKDEANIDSALWNREGSDIDVILRLGADLQKEGENIFVLEAMDDEFGEECCVYFIARDESELTKKLSALPDRVEEEE